MTQNIASRNSTGFCFLQKHRVLLLAITKDIASHNDNFFHAPLAMSFSLNPYPLILNPKKDSGKIIFIFPNVFYWGNPEMLFFSLFLILKGNFYSCPVGRDLSLFYLHIKFDYFCNSQILKALASCINGVFRGILPRIGACSDKFDDFVYAIHNVPPLMESGLIPVNVRTVKLSFAIVNND
jgi:hypothetical protein